MTSPVPANNAEARLLAAIAVDAACDLRDVKYDFDVDDADSDAGPDRTVRAEYLVHLLTSYRSMTNWSLAGASIKGDLNLTSLELGSLNLIECRIDGLHVSDCVFRDFELVRPRIHGQVVCSDSRFEGRFSIATAILYDYSRFENNRFNGDLNFGGSIFAKSASFRGSFFKAGADFSYCTFADGAFFDQVDFGGFARFIESVAPAMTFWRTSFRHNEIGPLYALRLNLQESVFHERVQLVLGGASIQCSGLIARSGIHIIARGQEIDLADAEFIRSSIVAHDEQIRPLWSVSDMSRSRAKTYPRPRISDSAYGQLTAEEDAIQRRAEISERLDLSRKGVTALSTLRRATLADLTLSGLDLRRCAFEGAHGLDRLRIDESCVFSRIKQRPFSSRQILEAENSWRQSLKHRHRWKAIESEAREGSEQIGPPSDSAPRAGQSAMEIATIYRSLRKGREDQKDEPGAADYYYGEMEMRRLAARAVSPRVEAASEVGPASSPAERALLNAYWAVSGYGLRAGRALVSLLLLVLICSALFSSPVFGHLSRPMPRATSVDLSTGKIVYDLSQPDPSQAASFGTALEFVARESLTVTRLSGEQAIIETTGIGTALDIALRLFAPVLLALAVLAIRARTKR